MGGKGRGGVEGRAGAGGGKASWFEKHCQSEMEMQGVSDVVARRMQVSNKVAYVRRDLKYKTPFDNLLFCVAHSSETTLTLTKISTQGPWENAPCRSFPDETAATAVHIFNVAYNLTLLQNDVPESIFIAMPTHSLCKDSPSACTDSGTPLGTPRSRSPHLLSSIPPRTR